MLSATAFEHNDIGYFVNSRAARIERYDVSAEKWLTPVTLRDAFGTPTVMTVDDDGIYAAFGNSVYRYRLDGSAPTFLMNTQFEVFALHTDGNLLLLSHRAKTSARFVSIDKTTNTVIDSVADQGASPLGSSISVETNRIFGRTQGRSPSDITYITYTDAGFFTRAGDSPYHGDYPDAWTTWVFPGGRKVVDDSGTAYAAETLKRVHSLGATITDIAFVESDIPIVLSGQTLTAYTSTILPAGSTVLDYSPTKILVNDHSVMTFTPDAASPTGYRAQAVPLASLSEPTPGPPVDPHGLRYTPDKVEVASDGTLLLLSKAHQSIFRWDPDTQRYGATIPLIGAPSHMAYSSPTNTVYLAYSSGVIRKIDLNAAQPREAAFAVLPMGSSGLAMAGDYLFAVDGSGWTTHSTFAPDGTLVDQVDLNDYSKEYVWSEANQKMYFFGDTQYPDSLHWEEINANGTAYPAEIAGGIGRQFTTFDNYRGYFAFPIRISPDEAIIVLGSGDIHDAATLVRSSKRLENSIGDAAWLGNELYTVRSGPGVMEFQHWIPGTFALSKSLQLPGVPLALKAIAADLLVGIGINSAGIPIFALLDAALNQVQINQAPEISLQNVRASLAEYTSTATAIKLAEIVISDDGLGANSLKLNGPDEWVFEIVGNELRLRAGTWLHYQSKPFLEVSVYVDDPTIGTRADDSVMFTLQVEDDPDRLHRWTNVAFPEDVDADGEVRARDALLVIDYLLQHGSHALTGLRTSQGFVDVTRDQRIGPRDGLRVINFLLLQARGNQPPTSNSGVSGIPIAFALAVDQSMAQEDADFMEAMADPFRQKRRR